MNHWAYLQKGGLVIVTVYGPTPRPKGFTRNQYDVYGINPDGKIWRAVNTIDGRA